MKDVHIVVILVVIVAGFFVLTGRPGPSEFAVTRTPETHSDIFFSYEVIRYPSSVEIAEPPDNAATIGFDVDPDKLTFGLLPADGGTAKRTINLTNRNKMPARVSLEVYGDIKPLLDFDKNGFVLTGNSTVEITASSAGQAPGNYSGEIDVIIQRSKYGLLAGMLGY